MKLNRDDVALGYEESGVGDPPLLLIHGWGTRRSLFAPLIQATAGAHRVVAVDLRGYGQSDAPMQDYSVEAYADDVAWVASKLGLKRPVIIGHSLGGLVALEFGSRFDPKAVVILESPVAAPPAMAAAIQPALDRLETKDYQATATAVFEMMLGAHFNPTERAQMLSYAQGLPQHVLSRTLRASVAYDSQSAAARLRCPVLYVGTSTPFADVARFRQLCPQLVTGQLVGCGHYFPLEVPDQLNPMIRRFLEVFVAGEGAARSS